MRILILTIEYPPMGGGASPMIHELNKQFVRHGHQVATVTMAHKDLPSKEIMDGVEVYRLNCFRSQTHISYFWEHMAFIVVATRFLKSYLKTHPVDFCFAHFLVPTGILARWLHINYKIPYIITAHGSDVPGYNPDRFAFLHRFTPPILRSVIHHSKNIIAPSRFLKTLIHDIRGIDSQKVIHIPSGIDTDRYIPKTKRPIILSTGRLLPRKGFQYLIDAVADEPFPFEVHICGDGPMMKTLQEKAKNSLTRIVFHGWIDNKSEQYITLLSEATIFSLVSAKENASTSLLEALSAGCAIITSDVSGCPESVGDAGICITPADIDALKTHLRNFAKNPQLIAQFSYQARERAIREFSWPSIAERYLALMAKADHS